MEDLTPEQRDVPPMRGRHRLWITRTELDFHATALVWAGVAAALFLLGWIAAQWVARPVADLETLAKLVPWLRTDVFPESDERRLYTVLTLLAPALLLAAWTAVRRFLPGGARNAAGAEWRGSSGWPVISTAVALAWASGAIYVFLRLPILEVVLRPAAPYAWEVAAGLAALSLALAWRMRRRPWKPWRNATLAAGLLLALAGTVIYKVFDFHTAGLIDTTNMNTVLYPISQESNGRHALVDFLPQYGCYAAILKPWFALIGLSMFKVSVTLLALQSVALGTLTFVLWRVLRSGWLLLLCVGALVWQGDIWQQAVLGSENPYLQYYPIRVVFPLLSPLLAWRGLYRPTRAWAVGTGVVGGLAIWWNIDTGAVMLVSLLSVPLARAVAGRGPVGSATRMRAGGHLGLALAGAAGTLAGVYGFLSLDARQWIDLGVIFHSQSLFYISGLAMVRMPASFHLWHLVVGVYLLGLAGAVGRVAGRRALGTGHGMILYLSVLGLGLFSYYQGRSTDVVMMLCLWPAVVLAVLLADRMLTAARYGLLPLTCATAALPALLLPALCAASLFLARAEIVHMNLFWWRSQRTHVDGACVPSNVTYIKPFLAHGESCAVISLRQSIYYVALKTPSGITGQSLAECLLQTDVDRYLTQIKARRVPHIFTDHTLVLDNVVHPLGPDFYRTLFDFYAPVGGSPSGTLIHWRARPDAEMHARPTDGWLAGEFAERSRLGASPPTARHALALGPAALLFNETGECALAPYDWGTIPWGPAWAVEMVFTPGAQQFPEACLISNHPGGGFDGLTVQHGTGAPPGTFYAAFGNGKSFATSPALAFTPGQKHYLAISATGNVVTIYLDGVAQPPVTLTGPVSNSVTPLTVGDWTAANRPFRGEISEVKIHAQALSAEVVAHNEQTIHPGAAGAASTAAR